MARIDDVARLAGVSTATVSRALRGLPTVSELTRARVLSAATQLGYVASPSASRLAGGKTRSVAAVVPRLTRWFFATVIEAAQDRLYEAGYDLLLYNLGGREQERRRLFHAAALTHRVDALMLIATPLHDEDFAAVTRLALPGVTVSSGTPVPGWPCVRIDDTAAGRTATEYLLRLGHRRIAHISGDPTDELAFTAHLDRRRGYLDALADAGVPADPSLDVEDEFTVAGGERAAAELLRRHDPPPTAIFAACDEIAMGAMATLRQAGLRVPQDVSVIGIDDHDLAGAVGLTTVAQPATEQGRLAATAILEQELDPRDPAIWEPDGGPPMVLPTRLIIRDSTAPPLAP
ncbi:LacI family DNA-binding transcriptional regulator [Rhizomonospora bruguierae]|uniref:LacI family DNA-binding transcriptional regulator n=1 Tax=Rhizomonospora bruguierae TaxID=1581705 RepID=UPI001BCE043B|nr:LacI family DNA-binding transcriptional regulator [Micromonospora sp. NBRC 107566]